MYTDDMSDAYLIIVVGTVMQYLQYLIIYKYILDGL